MYTGGVSAKLSINEMRKPTHNALVGHISIAFQMEEHRHVILVVRSIEARNVDQGAA